MSNRKGRGGENLLNLKKVEKVQKNVYRKEKKVK